MGIRNNDLGDIAGQLVPNTGDEAWVSDPDQPQHNHSGQSGEPHADGYYMHNDGSGPQYDKYHSD
ncbi:hypothetical protein I8H84_05595 [Candidatus Saccharibacteria bacterium]|nr:hypothetical protein [Candidatus Saccharibacteria bacterium]MBH1973191.1 hypothetical protein [Candidatus Saccharibacteria bacterium]MBH1990568.1 hypothetical protein [Candidatus Saccharibacteria bacterium]